MRMLSITALSFLTCLGASTTWAQSPQPNDLVFGLSDSSGTASMELVRGPAVQNGGAAVPDFWNAPFIESVEFDNFAGIPHNHAGNLLGVDFGTVPSGGSIYNFATTIPEPAGQLIGNTIGLGGAGLTLSRLGGLSVSPDNSKIAVTGTDSGVVYVFDYTAGDTMGFGASLSGGRETAPILCTLGDTQGTTWVNDDVLLAFSSTGEIFAVDATTMLSAVVATVDVGLPDPCGQGFTDLEFNPYISPFVYAMYGGFDGVTTTNKLAVIAGTEEGLIIVITMTYSGSMDTAREIALDNDGNLFVSQFGSAIDIIPNADDLESLTDNNSIDWYVTATPSSFNGIDVALETPVLPPGGYEPGTSEVPLAAPTGCSSTGDPIGRLTVQNVGDTAIEAGSYSAQLVVQDSSSAIMPKGEDTTNMTLAVEDDQCQGTPGGTDVLIHEIGHGFGSVYGFSGEYTLSSFDLGIPGRCLGTTIGRKCRSRVATSSAQGNGWDDAYNIKVEADGANRIISDGNTRRDTYTPAGDGTWTRPQFFRVIEQNPDNTYTLTFPDTGTWNFNALSDPVAPGKIASIVDRNGNTISFTYDPQGRLVTVTDTLGRNITFAYDGNGFIDSVTDFDGRTVAYEYYDVNDVDGCFGDLKSVTSPPVTGTPTGNDFPSGKTTTYTYTCGFLDDRLNHNLLTITDPKGQTYLTNVYAHTIDPNDLRYTTDPSDLFFDRIVRQILGDPGDTIDYFYVQLTPDVPNNFASIKTIVNDRDGNVREFFYDNANRLVMVHEYTGRAPDPDSLTTDVLNRPTGKLRPSDPEYFETRFQYNDDSLREAIVSANGDQQTFVYDELNPDRRSQGNMLQHCRLPGPLGGDQPQICESFEYEDGFGGCCGTNFVTRHVDGRGNETLHEYDAAGNRTHTVHRIPSIVEDFEYNAFGQITAYVLPDNGSGHRRRDEYTYYAPADGCMNGYLKERIIDAGGFGLTTTYEYDCLGRVTRSIDPRGNDSLIEYNALNQPVRTLSRDATGGGARYERLRWFDENDNLIRKDIENVDDLGVTLPNTHFSTIYEYDILNSLTRTCREKGSAMLAPTDLDCTSLPLGEFITTEYEYDANRNRTLIRNGEATNGNQLDNVLQTLYDERDLVFQTIRAPGTPDVSTTQYDYDGNRNVTQVTEGLEDVSPRVMLNSYDGYDRLWAPSPATTDPMGNTVEYHYDANGNRVSERVEGELVDVAGSAGNVRLAEVTYTYDAMDRLTQTDAAFFDTATQVPILDGFSTTVTTFSGNSQVLTTTDDTGDTTTTSYDTANRVATVTDPAGNTVTYTYDANSNVTAMFETEKSDLAGPDQTFTTLNTFDNIDRLIQTEDNVGNAHSIGYDSRNNRALITDALGNETRYAYDGINRLTATTRDLDNDGADGDGADITTSQSWDDSSRLKTRTDDNGNTTEYFYDSLNRVTSEEYADCTANSFAYDVHDNCVLMNDANANVSAYTYDLKNRMIEKNITPGPGVSTDTTQETYQYDGRSRLVRAEDDDSVVMRAHDSLNDITTETLTIVNGQPDQSTGATTAEYDGDGNQTTCTYPSGRTIACTYDPLDRKKLIEDTTGSPVMMAEYSYIGPSRVERREYGNGTRCEYTYDGITGVPDPAGDSGVKRIIGTTHSVIGSGSIIDDRTYLWDPTYNKTERKDVRAGGPQLTHDYAYDDIHRLIHTTVTDASPTIVRDTDYALDGVGNRTAVAGEPDAGDYAMDAALCDPGDLQMNQYTKTSFDQRAYDQNGNLVEIRSPLLPDLDFDSDVDTADFVAFVQCFGGAANPPAATCPPGVDADFDDNGDVSALDFALLAQCFGGSGVPPGPTCPFGGVVASYTYDYGDRLVEVMDADAARRHTYAYDALGRRIEKVVDADGAATETRYFYDGWQVLEEQDAAQPSPATLATYVYGRNIDEVLNMQRGGADFFYHTDDLDNVMAITDAAGAVVERYEYGDFGRPLDPNTLTPIPSPFDPSGIGNPFGFTGRRYDPESGWYYARYRYLDPRAGRFTTRDPDGYQADPSLNLFTWAMNRPTSLVDPMGLWSHHESPPPCKDENDTNCYSLVTLECRGGASESSSNGFGNFYGVSKWSTGTAMLLPAIQMAREGAKTSGGELSATPGRDTSAVKVKGVCFDRTFGAVPAGTRRPFDGSASELLYHTPLPHSQPRVGVVARSIEPSMYIPPNAPDWYIQRVVLWGPGPGVPYIPPNAPDWYIQRVILWGPGPGVPYIPPNAPDWYIQRVILWGPGPGVP